MPKAHRDPAFVAFHITAISEHVFIWLKCVIFWPAGRTDAVNNRKTVYRYFAPVDGVKGNPPHNFLKSAALIAINPSQAKAPLSNGTHH